MIKLKRVLQKEELRRISNVGEECPMCNVKFSEYNDMAFDNTSEKVNGDYNIIKLKYTCTVCNFTGYEVFEFKTHIDSSGNEPTNKKFGKQN
jgi:hypothetical protein